MQLARSNAILSFPTNTEAEVSTFGQEGRPAMVNADGTVEVSADALGNPPIGVILLGAQHPGRATVALAAGGLAGTVRVKLVQPVNAPGTLLRLHDSAGGVGFAPDPGSGARVVMAQALETGAIDELIEAVLFKPITYAA